MQISTFLNQKAGTNIGLFLLIFLPIMLVEIFILWFVSVWVIFLNDPMVFDTAQEVSFRQNIILGKQYWLDSAIYSTRATAFLSIFIALPLYYFNHLILAATHLAKRLPETLFILTLLTINLTGLYATGLMLNQSSHHWWSLS